MNEKDFLQQADDYLQVEKAISYVSANFKSRPMLDQIAENLRLSNDQLARLFDRWAGVGPIQFFQLLSQDHTRRKLAEFRGQDRTDSSSESRISGNSHWHDSFVHFEMMTSGESNLVSSCMKMEYGFHPTPFGECFLVWTEKGIHHLGFVESLDRDGTLNRFKLSRPRTMLSENRAEIGFLVNRIFNTNHGQESCPFHLLLKGTNFQITVWQTLLGIPTGSVASYEDIAAGIGRPKAVRAVANAVAANPVAYLIPCHRVIAKSGRIHQYRWGVVRKKAILGWEASRIKP
jgi:AraC family transcriptional regulator of adaptative response/methylated-DNA-[protein]-cysteine methyltransferase